MRSWLWWRRLILPAIFPAYVTGAVTASGGSWNAAIVAEIAKWGDTTLHATGIGAYIADMTDERRLPSHRARHHGAEPLRSAVQSPAVAAALSPRRRAPSSRLTSWMTSTHMDTSPLLDVDLISASGICKTYQQPDHAGRLVLDHIDFALSGRRDRRHPRQIGLGQIDLPAHRRRPDPAERRHGHLSRPAGLWAGARHRDGVPELRAFPLAHRARQCRARSRGARRAARRAAPARRSPPSI